MGAIILPVTENSDKVLQTRVFCGKKADRDRIVGEESLAARRGKSHPGGRWPLGNGGGGKGVLSLPHLPTVRAGSPRGQRSHLPQAADLQG